MQVYGIGGMLLKLVKSFDAESEIQLRVYRREGDYVPMKVNLNQGCVMSPW